MKSLIRPINVIIAFTLIGLSVGALNFFKKRENNLKSKTVTELIVTPFGYPHPYKLNHVAQYRFVHQVGEFLVRRDNYQNIIGGLAHSWTISNDRKSIVFHLRPNLYSAEEVAQSLRRLIKAKQTSHSNLAHQVANEDDIAVLNPLNLEIKTTGDAGAVLAPLVMADTVILPDDHWIKIPGYDDLQVDWSKTKGPYIYESGKFTDLEKAPIIFKPNPKHYFYSSDQLNWEIIYRPIGKISNLTDFKGLLEQKPSFSTVRFWDALKLYSSRDPGMMFYETRPNGISFLALNPKSKKINSLQSRLTILKRVLKAKIPLINPKLRADQIAQPGLSGRMLESELQAVLSKIQETPAVSFSEPLIWSLPQGDEANTKWVQQLAEAVDLPHAFKSGTLGRFDSGWYSGEYDIILSSIGMSDTDPISGATFLFSPTAANLDFPDGRILKILNSAKDTTDREMITKAVRSAFRMALEEGLIIPINYVTNRHYYSPGVELNIQDPYSESIRIWEVRLKD